MMNILNEMLSYPFITRAFIVGGVVSICAALLGVSIVLKRHSMIGDGLSHSSFGAMSIAVAFGWQPLRFSIPVVIILAIILLRMKKNSRINSDAGIAIVGAGSLAIGVAVTSLTTGMNTDVCNYMFGSMLTLSKSDVRLSVILGATVLMVFMVGYTKIVAITFDSEFSKVNGISVSVYETLVAILTAVVVVLGMRLMGAMLISSLIVFPALTSMNCFKSFKGVAVCSVIVSTVCFISGMMLSYEYNIPTGASIVIAEIAGLMVSEVSRIIRLRVRG